MNPDFEKLRELLELRDVGAFLAAYQEYRQRHGINIEVTGLTQRVLPALLRNAFHEGRMTAKDIVLLWRLVRDTRLLLVENDLLVAINFRINDAVAAVEPGTKRPVQPLATYEDVRPSTTQNEHSPYASSSPNGAVPVTEVKRVAIASAFSFGTWSSVDTFNFRKNLCASKQEYEFLRAVRQFYPSLYAYPNQLLRNFIDIPKLEATIPIKARNFAWSAQVDILLCTADEDPVLGIELDSVHHDSLEAAERDELKNLLFKLAGVPLVRIRAADTNTARAEDFYDLLMARADELEKLRPRRLRPRRNHDFLVPTAVVSR